MKVRVISRDQGDYVRRYGLPSAVISVKYAPPHELLFTFSRTKGDIQRTQTNVDPKLHPLEAAREYKRALNASKGEGL